MVNKSYDVAIVGAGPAGASAAGVLAKNGFNTLLLDRRSRIGLPVQCGELLPTSAEIRDIFPRSKYMPKLVDVPMKYVTNKTSQTALISPNGHAVKFDFMTNIIDRAKFDVSLVNTAVDAGCKLRLLSIVKNRSPNNILTIKTESGIEDINAQIVIGADGPNSIISKSLGNLYHNPEKDFSLSLNYVMRGVECDEDMVLMFFGRNIAPGGYFWIIPKGDSTSNVGFGLRRSLADPDVSLTTYMKNFIAKSKIASPMLKHAKILSRVSALIPMAGPVTHTCSDNVLLVGDAAGHVMASNGGGIPQALGGGYIAGHVTASHFEKGTALSVYEQIWRNEFGRELDAALSILRIADGIMTSDSLTNICMCLAGRQFLEPLIRCRLPLPVEFVSKTFVRVFNSLIS